MPTIIDGNAPNAIEIAVNALIAGDIVALPTETVYGLAADATNDIAVKKIYSAKGRPTINPLICHIHEDFDLTEYVEITDDAKKLMYQFWPGPLSMIFALKPNSSISNLVTAGLSSVALRAPNHSIFRQVLKSLGHPIAAPSANRSESLSPTTAQHVKYSLPHTDMFILNGGHTNIGLESTIIDVRSSVPTLLRYGSVTAEKIENCLNKKVIIKTSVNKNEDVLSPGQMLRHYAPTKKLYLNITTPDKDCAWLSFGANNLNHPHEFNLSISGNLSEAAQNLFSFLWKADKLNVKSICVAPIPDKDVGIAINDRLKRAANEN